MRNVRKRGWKRDFETLEWNDGATGWIFYLVFLVASIAVSVVAILG
jgi:hypothetical protein